jgi:hypothetical protein
MTTENSQDGGSMLKDNLSAMLHPILEAHEYVSVHGLNHELLFLGLTRRVTCPIAVLITVLHARRGHRDMGDEEFVERLKEFIPDDPMEDLLTIRHISWAVDYIAISTSHQKAFEALRGTLGESLAVVLTALDVCSRSGMQESAALVDYLVRHVPHDSLWSFFTENSGLRFAQKFTNGYLDVLGKTQKIGA